MITSALLPPMRPTLRRLALAAALLCAVMPAEPAAPQGGGVEPAPFAPREYTYGRRLDESQLRFCVDRRDGDWEVAQEIGTAVASALLLDPVPYVVKSESIAQEFEDIYGVMLDHCDLYMGFKLLPQAYPEWMTLTRAYYSAAYVFVTQDPGVKSLGDVPFSQPIAATMGTSADIRLVSYLLALPANARWPHFPMGTNELTLQSVLDGTAPVGLVWAPELWAKQRSDQAYAGLRVIGSAPLPPTTEGVGAVMLAKETFLRTAVDQAITALINDGTIVAILEKYAFPATAKP
jgi:polar amino acid transport system substrate-binding protein